MQKILYFSDVFREAPGSGEEVQTVLGFGKALVCKTQKEETGRCTLIANYSNIFSFNPATLCTVCNLYFPLFIIYKQSNFLLQRNLTHSISFLITHIKVTPKKNLALAKTNFLTP